VKYFAEQGFGGGGEAAHDASQGRTVLVVCSTFRDHRELPRLEAQHEAAQWRRFLPVDEAKCTVGVMGYGSIGVPIADVLMRLGFPVAVWTRTKRSLDGVQTFAGSGELGAFLARSAILVCSLPLTRSTAGLLATPAFAALPRNAFVVNVSRGAVLREADLVTAIDRGHLAGAALDVFETEPLPATSPLWKHPKILCTPHIAAMPRPEVAARQFLDNLRRARDGLALLNVVDRSRGY